MIGARQQRFVVAAADRDWIRRLGCRSVDDVLAIASDEVAAVSRSSNVVRVPIDSATGGPSTVFVKRYLYERRGQRIKQMFRGTLFGKSRAHTEYDFLEEMRRRRVPSVRPIAYGERRRGMFLRASFLITEGIEGGRSLDLFALDDVGRHGGDRPDRGAMIQGLAETVRQMHDAGVRHGGLYWRNILMQVRPDGVCRFGLLDPDTHGRLFPASVPEDDAVSDLSELIASGIALGMRGGLRRFMKAYHHTETLSAAQCSQLERALDGARRLVPAEQQRMAVTESIEWLRKRVAGSGSQSRGPRPIDSLDRFFELLTSTAIDSERLPQSRRTIDLVFSGVPGRGESIERTVTVEGGRLSVGSKRGSNTDLVIRSDPETWLAVVSGSPDAHARVLAGGLRMEGDARLLPVLVMPIDAGSAPESSGGTTRITARPSVPGPEVAATSQQPVQRSFGRKYKTDDFAKYYADKHRRGPFRRVSSFLERQMIHRALHRIRRRHSFHKVLDCPSGTGRFLPTLAAFDVSVIPMDTSEEMLREGRKYYPLFRKSPSSVAGSAFEIPLSDNSVDVVLCARLLHHIPERDARVNILKEFARVARVGVVISFFDDASYRAWKRRRKTRRTGRQSGRQSMTRKNVTDEAGAAGLIPVGMNALFRFHSEITAGAFLV